MSTDTLSGAAPEAPAAVASAAAPVRPFYWSVRRELWENRAIYIAPLAVAGVLLFGFLIGSHRLADAMRQTGNPEVMAERHVIPYHIAAFAIMVTTGLVGVFYALAALNGERRDRTILFWKSLPISDHIAVLSKAFIPLVVLPIVAFAVIVATQLAMLLLSTIDLLLNGMAPGVLWNEVPLANLWVVLAYGLVALSLWQAPLWGWLLLVSAWAKRMTFIWAVAPPLALMLFEKIAFDTGVFAHLIGQRIAGGFETFTRSSHGVIQTDLSQLDPVGFVTNPGLWIGLVVAAAFLAGAVWLRRRREPI
jgi:ABC-2 type transport system permease protein